MANSTQGGQAGVSHVGAFDASAVKDIQDTLCQGAFTSLVGTADAIPFPGNVELAAGSADACTLALPVAGPQPLGDDGKTIFIYDKSGKAHTVTAPANGIINSKHLLTWNGTIGSNLCLVARGGIWVIEGTPNGVTVS